MADTYAYEIKGSVYINLTNECTNKCGFCLRSRMDGVAGYNLWLEKEPTAEEVIAQMKKYSDYSEVVFCGFGEPMLRMDTLLEVARYAKSTGKRVRINTNGQASLYHGRNVAKELQGLVDCVSISLNALDAARYDALCHSIFGKKAHKAVLEFASECKKYVPEVVLSVVDILPESEIKKCEELAEKMGAKFRIRHYVGQ
ncbi:MAG: TatD family nuclease-associated radical SAM protein [Bacillota bacterium]|nr:TatD family nuclease-associated radical SAM protein [Bacillota bacterium]